MVIQQLTYPLDAMSVFIKIIECFERQDNLFGIVSVSHCVGVEA